MYKNLLMQDRNLILMDKFIWKVNKVYLIKLKYRVNNENILINKPI